MPLLRATPTLYSGRAAAVATLDFALPADVRFIRFSLSEIDNVTTGADFQMRLSTDNGSSYSTTITHYVWAGTYKFADGTTGDASSGSGGAIPVLGSDWKAGYGGLVDLVLAYNHTGLLWKTMYSWQALTGNTESTAKVVRTSNGTGRFNQGTVTNVRFMFSSGNIAEINYVVQAIR